MTADSCKYRAKSGTGKFWLVWQKCFLFHLLTCKYGTLFFFFTLKRLLVYYNWSFTMCCQYLHSAQKYLKYVKRKWIVWAAQSSRSPKKSVIDVLSARIFVYVVLQVIQIYRTFDTVVSGWYISLTLSWGVHYDFSLKMVCIKYKILRKFLSFHLLRLIKHIVDYAVLVNTGIKK